MVLDKLYTQGNILGAALNAASVRNEVITSNIANNDTPGYKTKVVDFEDSLLQAIDQYKSTGKLDLSGARPSIRVANGQFNYRIDENNVDMELEMVNLYQNSVKYETMINSLLNNSKRLNLAITGR